MKLRLPYNIHKTLFKILPMSLLLGAAVSGCKPDEPNIQATGLIIWNWNENLENAPDKKTVKAFADNEYVSEVHISMQPKNVPYFTGATFNAARDTLQKLIDINPDKVKGSGEIRVNPVNGATFLSPDSTMYGMAIDDSIWFVQH